MAAIDKLRCKSYYEYQEFLKWCIAYLPQAIPYFRDITLTHDKWEKNVKEFIKEFKRNSKKDYERLGKFSSRQEAIENLRDHYKTTADYDAPDDQLIEEVSDCLVNISMSDNEICDRYSYTVACFPFKIDKKLKWRCPISFVRKYLWDQCGVKRSREWLYSKFFKY